MKNILVAFLLLISCSTAVIGQDDRYTLEETTQIKQQKFALYFDTRFDFDAKISTDTNPNQAGFAGKYLQFYFDGQINEYFSYKFSQRLNIPTTANPNIWGATEVAWLAYNINSHFALTAGKQVVAIGGFEYDESPINVYYWSDFWNNVVCYQMGLTFTYRNEKNTFMAQFVNSPFSKKVLENIWSYNLMWLGKYDWFQSIYSVNFLEYEKNKFINYIALGNRFKFNNFCLDIDIMNRAGNAKEFFFKDFSLIGRATYRINSQWNVFAKGGYDCNSSQTDIPQFDQPNFNINDAIDRFVLPGTSYAFYGAGVEFYPIKNKEDLRVHAAWYSNNNAIQYQNIQLGVRWKIKAI